MRKNDFMEEVNTEVMADMNEDISEKNNSLIGIIQHGTVEESHNALNNLYMANQGLIKKIVYQITQAAGAEEFFEDLVHDAYEPLKKAAFKFNPEEDKKFSSYAGIAIKRHLNDCMNTYKNRFTVSKYMQERIITVMSVKGKLLGSTGKEPSYQEIADECSLTAAEVEGILSVNFSISYVDSIDKMVRDNNQDEGSKERQISEIVEDCDAVTPLSAFISAEEYSSFRDALKKLDARELRVIKARFLSGDDNIITLEELGRELGVTKERVHQIEKAAIQKLRNLCA